MTNKALQLTQSELMAVLHYDKDTGLFTRLSGRGRYKAGTIAGTKISSGYIQINLNRVTYLAHRLAWLYVTGNFPLNVIDHKDRVKDNNAWDNLRDATSRENSHNAVTNSASIGVAYRPNTNSLNPYEAYIYKGNKRIYLGYHKTEELALIAYNEARTKIEESYD